MREKRVLVPAIHDPLQERMKHVDYVEDVLEATIQQQHRERYNMRIIPRKY